MGRNPSDGLAFDSDYIGKKENDIKVHLIARSYDLAVKKAKKHC